MDQNARFWSAVDKSGECWIWQRAILSTGYGAFRATEPERRMVSAHKFSYELANGPVPAGLVVDHICHEMRCVRPDHLRAVTRKQNSEHRAVESGQARSGIRGVVWNGTRKTWMAQVRHERKLYIGGQFSTIEEAAACVRELRNRLFTNNSLDRSTA